MYATEEMVAKWIGSKVASMKLSHHGSDTSTPIDPSLPFLLLSRAYGLGGGAERLCASHFVEQVWNLLHGSSDAQCCVVEQTRWGWNRISDVLVLVHNEFFSGIKIRPLKEMEKQLPGKKCVLSLPTR